MAAVRAADLRRVGLALGDGDAPRHERGDRRHEHALDALAVAERVRGVDDVVARGSEVDVPARLLGDLRADHVHERAEVMARLGLLVRDLLRQDLVGGARDGVRDRAIADALVGEGHGERALDARLVAHHGGGREVRMERTVDPGIAPIEAVVERREGVEAVRDRHPASTLAAMPSRSFRTR